MLDNVSCSAISDSSGSLDPFGRYKADTAGSCRAAAGASRRVRALRAQLRRLWARELRAATRRPPRQARGLASRMAIPLLCAPRGWGLEALLRSLCRTLGRIDASPEPPPTAERSAMAVAARVCTRCARSIAVRSSSELVGAPKSARKPPSASMASCGGPRETEIQWSFSSGCT